MILPILWPTFALVALIFVVWLVLFVQRLGHMRRTPPAAQDFATSEAAGRYFAPVEGAGNNLKNLFEMPVLFLALVPLLIAVHHVTLAQVVLAWLFVAARAAHSLFHIQGGVVKQRFLAYLISCAILSAMWIGFFVDMLSVSMMLSRLV